MRINFSDSCCDEEKEVRAGQTIDSLIKELKRNKETFIIKLNGKIAHESEALKEGDRLELVNVIFGG